MSKRAEEQRQALSRAVTGQSGSNYPIIYSGFLEKGILEEEIKPRENIFTFDAWKALGRFVRKGEHGVRVITYLEGSKTETDPTTGEEVERSYRRPWHTTVFHISQTEERKESKS